MASGQNRIVVDLDGTLVQLAWPDLGWWLAGAREALQSWLDQGYEVVVFSTRLSDMEVDEITPRAYSDHQFEIDRLRQLLDDEGLVDVKLWLEPYKPGGLVYIDDKAVRFEGNWEDTYARVAEVLNVQG